MKPNIYPTQEYLHTILNYEEENGKLYWKKHFHKRFVGKEAGSKPRNDGYRRISINNKCYYLHRVVWIYLFGNHDSTLYIDHINGNKSDNSRANLRLVTFRENQHNLLRHRQGEPLGVTVFRRKGQLPLWQVRLPLVNGLSKWVGTYTTKEEAVAVAQAEWDRFFRVEKAK